MSAEIDWLSREALSDVSFESLKNVYDRIKLRSLSGHLPSDSCPPLYVLIFTIRSIIHGKFLYDEIQSIILLLCNVEFIRHQMDFSANEEQYRADNALATEQRIDFRKALNGLAALDVFELLRLSISSATADRAKIAEAISTRLQLYFPDYLDITKPPTEAIHPQSAAFWHCFHVDLFISEKRNLALVAKHVVEAVVSISQLLGTSMDKASLNSELRVHRSYLPSEEAVKELIEGYVSSVQTYVDRI